MTVAVAPLVLASCLLQRFVEYLFHRLFHSRWLFHWHVTDGHHAQQRRRDTEVYLTVINLAVCATVFELESALAVPRPLRYLSAGTIFIVCVLALALHRRVHDPETWFLRFSWFRALRRLHGVHHREDEVSRNYALFYPFWFDRLFGTYGPVHETPTSL